jgi:hypothetical protein
MSEGTARDGLTRPAEMKAPAPPWQNLDFLPLPHQQGRLRPALESGAPSTAPRVMCDLISTSFYQGRAPSRHRQGAGWPSVALPVAPNG